MKHHWMFTVLVFLVAYWVGATYPGLANDLKAKTGL